MRNISFYISMAVIYGVFAGTAFATNGSTLSNPALRNPVGTGTVPQTTYRSGLVRSPNPIDRSSNLVITGNVGGGRHFRGSVPYNALSDFAGTLGSSTLDSFLRRSAVSQDYYRFTGSYTPYYSETRTVTTTAPGISRIVTPPSTKIRTQTPDLPALRSAPSGLAAISGDIDMIYTGFRPVTITEQQLESISLKQADQSEVEKLLEQRYKAKVKELDSRLKQLSQKANKLQQELTDKEQPSLLPDQTDTAKGVSHFFEKTAEQAGQEIYKKPKEQLKPPVEKLDIYEKMQQELEEFQKTYIEQLSAPEEQQQQKGKSLIEDITTAERSLEYKQAPRITKEREEPKQITPQKSTPLTDMADAEIFREAKKILGEHKTFVSYSNDKYNRYLRAAEEYLKTGRFYRAADAYSLASIYKPNDPLVYAGRSHALFAAGEYMSSALFLARAIEMFPEYVEFKIDIVAMIGSIDTVEKRIADVKERLQITEVPELHFLLGYVYLQIDRIEKAGQAIDAAYTILPKAPAVIVLKKAIEKRAEN